MRAPRAESAVSQALESRVRRVRVLARASRALESLVIGGAVATLVASSAAWSSPLTSASAGLGPGLFVGALFAGLAWRHLDWSLERTAAALDRALALEDALPAALRANAGGLGLREALSQRVLGAWRSSEVWRALLPRAWALALLALCVALWLLPAERAGSPSAPAARGAALAQAARALGQAARSEPEAWVRAEAEPLVRALEQWTQGAGSLEELRSRAEALAATLAERSFESPRNQGLAQALQQLRSQLGGSTPAGRSAPAGAGGDGASGAGSEYSQGVASGAGEGTMGDSGSSTASNRTAVAPPALPEAGLGDALPARWWPQRHDELIRRWSEIQEPSTTPR